MKSNNYDVIVLGSGPAGLQAAIHAARRGAMTLVMGRLQKSNAFSAHIDNYCCISGNSGSELLELGRAKGIESGAEFIHEDATEVARKDGNFSITAEGGETLISTSIVLALGVTRERLNVKGEKEFKNRGISYCVDCDAGFYKGESVAVIGSSSAAVTGALMLLFYAKDVHLICDHLDVSDYLVRKVKESWIQIHEHRMVVEIYGEDFVKGVMLDNGVRIAVSGVFIELGAKGAVEVAGNLGIAMDDATMKFVVTNKKQETNVPGVYAAGDICGVPWQIAKAIGEGCIAGLEAAEYAKKHRSS
jgi:thioredoxin reductase (NADPH)